jgi:hypothetical protein
MANRNYRRRVENTASASAEAGKTSEKRVFSRVECLMDLELENGSSESARIEPIEAIDLSLLGLGFQRGEGSEPIPLGRTVKVAIHGFPAVQAQVRWIRGSRVGVQFCGRLHDIMESWVGEVLAAQGVKLGDLFEAGRF